MLRRLCIVLLVTLLATTSLGGVRARGKYAGIVIFDRWDTCYLYSGTYLMYVSSKTKERLRKYQGKAVTIYAQEVFQPRNPGDGLITKFKFLSLAKNKQRGLHPLSLTVEPHFEKDKPPSLVLVIENRSASSLNVSAGALAPTLLGPKLQNMFSPSDGESDAWLTRSRLKMPAFLKEIGFGPKTDKSHPVMREGNIEYYLHVEKELPDQIVIPANGKTTIAMSFYLPKGEYDFLFGYEGGVHEVKGIASNLLAFSVDENGRAFVDTVVRR